MPGYIMHLTEAKLICSKLREAGLPVSEKWEHCFQIGALLPDSKQRGEKQGSHFWNPASLDRLAIAPDLRLFHRKYGRDFTDPLMLGYRAHLQMDTAYVEEYWDKIVEFLDADGRPAVLRDQITTARIKKTGQMIPREDFFSRNYYYGDYSRSNCWLMEKYGIRLPAYDPAMTCPIEEVSIEDMRQILDELQELLLHCSLETVKDLRVFDPDSLTQFVETCAERETGEIMKQISGT